MPILPLSIIPQGTRDSTGREACPGFDFHPMISMHLAQAGIPGEKPRKSRLETVKSTGIYRFALAGYPHIV